MVPGLVSRKCRMVCFAFLKEVSPFLSVLFRASMECMMFYQNSVVVCRSAAGDSFFLTF